MNIEDQVVSLELSIKLKDLGVEQNCLYYYNCIYEGRCVGDKCYCYTPSLHESIADSSSSYSAYTAQELLELLKGAFINIQYSTPFKGKLSVYYQPENGTDNSYSFIGENMANLLAQVLIAQINEGEFKN